MPLTSLRLLFGLATLDLLVVLLVVRYHRRTRRLLGTAAGGLAVLLVAVVGLAAGINRHFDLYRSWSDLLRPSSADLVAAQGPAQLARATAVKPAGAAPGRGTVLSLRIPSPASHLSVDGAYVYLPPQYREAASSSRSFPVVEAFSGSPGRPGDWLNGVRADAQLDKAISAGQLAAAIVVFPPTNTSILRSLECTDTADGLHDETYLTTDVHSWITSHLRTDGRRWTAIGYSTGGYCALDLSFRHPDLFARAISLDGYGRALQDHYARRLWRNRSDRLAHSPDWWVRNHRPEGVAVYLVAGTADRSAAHDTLATWRALDQAGWLTPTDRLVAQRGGRHTFDDWSRAFLPGLEWALPGAATPLRDPTPQVAQLQRR